MDISYIDTERLLSLIRDHGAISTGTKRKWTFVHGENGKSPLKPLHGVPVLVSGTGQTLLTVPSLDRALGQEA